MKALTAIMAGLLMMFMSSLPVIAGNCDPDSLTEITASGVVLTEPAGNHVQYFLKVDQTIYKLNFGPWWYEPSSGDAERPDSGSVVTVFGGLNESNPGAFAVIVVYEIDGEYWRNPYDPSWNHFNDSFSSDPESFDDGVACGWPDSVIDIEAYFGVAVVDTTLKYNHYFLDTDFDELPNYKLNFGPPWYEPVDSILLPLSGDTIEIEGAIIHVNQYPIIVVFKINDLIWRDTTGYGDGSFGKWMKGSQNDDKQIHSPFDAASQLVFQKGWHKGGVPGNMYCQLLEVFPANHGGSRVTGAFAAFELAFMDTQRNSYMHRNEYRKGMQFNNPVTLQLHYTQRQLERLRIKDGYLIRAHYWNNEEAQWLVLTNAFVDTSLKVVTVVSETLHSFYILTGEDVTSPTTNLAQTANSLSLWPNPADNVISIRLDRIPDGMITLHIYTTSGKLVQSTRYDNPQESDWIIRANVAHLMPGMYIAAVHVNGEIQSHRFVVE